MNKHLISLRIDQDTLKWFRGSFPKGYQTKMNQILVKFKHDREHKVAIILERAEQLYKIFHCQCFWHLNKDLRITPAIIPMVQEGLRKNGGREGYRLASSIQLEDPDAD